LWNHLQILYRRISSMLMGSTDGLPSCFRRFSCSGSLLSVGEEDSVSLK
jgi:hypothetical protein